MNLRPQLPDTQCGLTDDINAAAVCHHWPAASVRHHQHGHHFDAAADAAAACHHQPGHHFDAAADAAAACHHQNDDGLHDVIRGSTYSNAAAAVAAACQSPKGAARHVNVKTCGLHQLASQPTHDDVVMKQKDSFEKPSTENEQFSSAFALLLSTHEICTIYFYKKLTFFSLTGFLEPCTMYYVLCTYLQKSKNSFFPLSVWFFAKTNIKFVHSIQWDFLSKQKIYFFPSNGFSVCITFSQKQKFDFFPSIIKGFFTSKAFPNLAHHV